MGFRELRQLAVLTQAELALKAGVSQATIVNIEAGRISPQPGTVRKLATALGVPPADVVRAIRQDQQDAKLAA